MRMGEVEWSWRIEGGEDGGSFLTIDMIMILILMKSRDDHLGLEALSRTSEQ